MALLIPIFAMLIPISAIVMNGIIKIVKTNLEEAKVRAGVLPDGSMAELEQMRGEIERVRHELADVHERLDFTERLLAQRRAQDRLPGQG